MEPEQSSAVVPDPTSAALTPFIEVERVRALGLASAGPPPYVLEIGFGRGELLLTTAREHPERTFIGLDISRKRVLKMERRVIRAELPNIRLLHAPAQYVLERVLPEASLMECWIHCPDPWPKKRHHRRRLLQPSVASELARVLAPDGRLLLSTDHEPYAEWIHAVLAGEPRFETLFPGARWSWDPPERPRTAYESEWIAEGRRIAYFSYRRVAEEPGK